MKKLYYLIVLTLILGLVLTGCFLSNVGQVPTNEQSGITYLTRATEGAPLVTTLFADQDIDVGTVSVWNNDENLYVTYNTIGGWEIVETHLHVALDKEEIPHTKKGNPIPGQFDYSMCHVPWVTEYTYSVSLGDWESCDKLYIAAHAKVVHITQGCINLVSDESTMVIAGNDSLATYPINSVEAWEPGPGYPNDGPDDSSWEASSLWDSNTSYNFLTSGAEWIWESYRVLHPVIGDVVTFEKPFVIPGLYTLSPTTGTIAITCDNGYIASILNSNSTETEVARGQVADDFWMTNLTESFVNSQGWQSVETESLDGASIGCGTNTLKIVAANENYTDNGAGTISNNPGGLIYEAEVCYEVVDQEETAWGDGERFVEKGNWATYFNYTVDESYMVGTWSVDWVFLGTIYDRLIIIDTQVGGAIDGVFWVINHPTLGNKKTGTIKGTINCDGLVYMIYTRTDIVTDYTAELWGTVHADGESVSGTWGDNKGNTGTWTAYLQ